MYLLLILFCWDASVALRTKSDPCKRFTLCLYAVLNFLNLFCPLFCFCLSIFSSSSSSYRQLTTLISKASWTSSVEQWLTWSKEETLPISDGPSMLLIPPILTPTSPHPHNRHTFTVRVAQRKRTQDKTETSGRLPCSILSSIQILYCIDWVYTHVSHHCLYIHILEPVLFVWSFGNLVSPGPSDGEMDD